MDKNKVVFLCAKRHFHEGSCAMHAVVKHLPVPFHADVKREDDLSRRTTDVSDVTVQLSARR